MTELQRQLDFSQPALSVKVLIGTCLYHGWLSCRTLPAEPIDRVTDASALSLSLYEVLPQAAVEPAGGGDILASHFTGVEWLSCMGYSVRHCSQLVAEFRSLNDCQGRVLDLPAMMEREQ